MKFYARLRDELRRHVDRIVCCSSDGVLGLAAERTASVAEISAGTAVREGDHCRDAVFRAPIEKELHRERVV